MLGSKQSVAFSVSEYSEVDIQTGWRVTSGLAFFKFKMASKMASKMTIFVETLQLWFLLQYYDDFGFTTYVHEDRESIPGTMTSLWGYSDCMMGEKNREELRGEKI